MRCLRIQAGLHIAVVVFKAVPTFCTTVMMATDAGGDQTILDRRCAGFIPHKSSRMTLGLFLHSSVGARFRFTAFSARQTEKVMRQSLNTYLI